MVAEDFQVAALVAAGEERFRFFSGLAEHGTCAFKASARNMNHDIHLARYGSAIAFGRDVFEFLDS